jgi:hypothetical protein
LSVEKVLVFVGRVFYHIFTGAFFSLVGVFIDIKGYTLERYLMTLLLYPLQHVSPKFLIVNDSIIAFSLGVHELGVEHCPVVKEYFSLKCLHFLEKGLKFSEIAPVRHLMVGEDLVSA